MTRRCVTCGIQIRKSGLKDPYICRPCEKARDTSASVLRYSFLDRTA